MKWVLTPDEFSHVWANETSLDRRPYPVNLAPGATVRTESEYQALRLPQRFARQADPDLAAALMLCARTDATTITISGERTIGARNGDGPSTETILVFAAVVHHHAAILHAAGPGMTVRMCHARTLGKRLVRIIGSAEPGRIATLRQPQDAVLTVDEAPIQAAGCRDAARFRQLLRKPVDGRGFITVTVEPENPISPPTRHRSWLDIRGDGRYLLTSGNELVLAPACDDSFAEQLQRLAQIR
ncbi:ESX secretion-associated protein EspG [Nocardia donostiensis]|uniref:ESX secretion-associated protein EspG n=1 Tax=Nocardia donostiensis TaxID=1538463 RepID=A0A1W0AY37_9NOCA|nr:ESX secretion-associated protein EspG [Nocardia donostiensis]ONM47561.1 ESX secretion-associated protein EspG [Nocardia donostiensis]OQS15096.1 ESX secretion-associated protein EspG [Nocardia donostiensis]OQS24269.1 ESX secretion-associated protein EspG [Nocardia donostiensis]